MQLQRLLSDVSFIEIKGTPETEISSIGFDSRKAAEGFLFIAVNGTTSNGHDYISSAIECGCKAIVCEYIPKGGLKEGITYVLVKESAESLGAIASAWYGHPSQNIILTGVTGTNGKTTIATTLYNLFRKLGYKAGLLSTVCNIVEEEQFPTANTTPDPITINELLAMMVDKGCQYAFMEVSSHAVVQKRIHGLHFAGGIFTNLTRDHLDYHKTVDAYLKAKKSFFDMLPSQAFALTNLDDKTGLVMLQNTSAKKYSYSLLTLADFKGKILEKYINGMSLQINGKEAHVQFIGRFNASNLLAIYGTAILLGQHPDEVLVALSDLHPVAGRFETIHSKDGVTAIVDYAHTPDALVNVLQAIHEVVEGNGKIITVVGAGGNRDKGKRPIMAKESAKGSDQIILTSDNPRFEEPEDILNDMLEGLTSEQKKKALVIQDRKQAIKTACMLAKKGDVILIAGKGHENYQDIKGVKHHFDDKEIVEELFNNEI